MVTRQGGVQGGRKSGTGQEGTGQHRAGRGHEQEKGRQDRTRSGGCVCVLQCVRASPFGLESLPSWCVFAFASVAAMASSGVDLLLADCLAVGQEVSERV